jgi:hypothetical protein
MRVRGTTLQSRSTGRLHFRKPCGTGRHQLQVNPTTTRCIQEHVLVSRKAMQSHTAACRDEAQSSAVLVCPHSWNPSTHTQADIRSSHPSLRCSMMVLLSLFTNIGIAAIVDKEISAGIMKSLQPVLLRPRQLRWPNPVYFFECMHAVYKRFTCTTPTEQHFHYRVRKLPLSPQNDQARTITTRVLSSPA